jgi:hypothetical protein
MEGLPPDFLLDFVALIHCMRLSSRKGAHAALSSEAWQEIRVARLFRPTVLQIRFLRRLLKPLPLTQVRWPVLETKSWMAKLR